MDELARIIAFSGLAMFVFGLALGFVLKLFPNPRAALSAHLNGVQSGTFLIALALLWPRLAIWPALAGTLCHAIWIAFWALEIGMTAGALAKPADKGTKPGPVRITAGALQALGAVAMFIALAALLLTFAPATHAGGA